ncbi:hypothetical protein CISG_06648 [Coccidioides immitis RMSCC 3703]|uniref:Uncharacterized protein n=2 Tax=Coccidioides immitis TaxID=5501 RepID=A0A0J8QY59_COCIT|nr:hypothetical protein CIRG_02650 [Coccidioides immitis RMSCC 2394]KMU77401.1 hypothetical protein CISG_06648 [Coccidioides immitis RMSCC 3703]
MPPNSAALQTDLQPSSSQCRDLGQPKKFSTMVWMGRESIEGSRVLCTVTGRAFWSSLALAPTDARIGQAFSLLWRLGESNHARRPITAARTLPHLESTASVALP